MSPMEVRIITLGPVKGGLPGGGGAGVSAAGAGVAGAGVSSAKAVVERMQTMKRVTRSVRTISPGIVFSIMPERMWPENVSACIACDRVLQLVASLLPQHPL